MLLSRSGSTLISRPGSVTLSVAIALIHSSDVDAGILADILASIKIDLGHFLSSLDANVLADIRVCLLNALGIKLNAHVSLTLGLDLGVILGDVVGDCKHAGSTILADLKLAIGA